MKKSRVKIAIIGIEHVHAWSMYHEFNRDPERVEWLGCADISGKTYEAARVLKERNLAGCDIKLYKDFKELLDLKPDLVIVCSSIRGYPDAVEESLSRNLNTLIEKPMAINFEDAARMYRAYKKSNATFAINWPVSWYPTFNCVKKLAASGKVGDILRVHYRSPATLGPYEPGKYKEDELLGMFWYNHSEGGGSAIDYAGYGCMLATWLFGKQAESVMGIRKNFFLKFSDVEDYSAYLLDFGNGVASIEGSWSTINNGEIPTGPIVYGSKGVIVADRYKNEVKVYTEFSHQNTEPNEVYECLQWDKREDGLCTNMLDHIQKGTLIDELLTPEFNIKAMAALDAGIRSSYSGKAEKTKTVNTP